ncbi:MAG: dienelactone hydrolase [Oceanicaulis sp.]|uniref:dienelactone hydrolase family protein n=1 Tax=Oceanicaulis sp. UBA2681 TaxID=1947007 RepID=UPI000C0AD379|nr:dienelactone hydrolase family protein [Oceanicaulis sp. UBA2681]MAP49169.1 dienelactone hydrolase [Oceanicaulis sp.]HCR65599.1 dienelactone hydrolase [Oceanicaulis sp.]|tara:strand:+ start:582 stop:1469 length:888 start_codon:yes stop_codon:yes gene_type:complete
MPKSDPEIAQGAFKLYDAYAHGAMSRRDFLDGLKAYAIGGLTVSVLAAALMPNYATAQQTEAGDSRLVEDDVLYASPDGAGEMSGYLVRPAGAETPRGGVLVIHENRGLNPHIRDVARRAALAGYVAFAPDALHPLGGYPGTDDEGRTLQRQRDGREMLQDFIAGAHFLRDHPACSGQVAAVGFCYGGAVANQLAVRLDWLAGSVPFYGGWPDPENAEAVRVPLQIHLAALDDRVNAGWPVWRDALDAADAPYQVFMYEGAQHGFHNDTTARFDPEQAELAWSRTLDFFDRVLTA